MPRGRKPTGNRPLTAAQRQARYRQRQSDNGAASAPRPARPMRQVSRPQQWHAPTGQARGLKAHGAALLRLQAEYAAWFDALPEALRDGATGEALQTIDDLDLDELASIEPPRGFGRD